MHNWFVITGGPSAGKTMLIDALRESGYHVEYESARILIDEEIAKGRTIQDTRKDELVFQEKVLDHKIKREERLDSNDLIFFDRGIHDSIAYYALHDFPISDTLRQSAENASYKKVFLLEPFSFEEDYARTESEDEQEKLFSLLRQAYDDAGMPPVIIPTFPEKEERIKFFFELLEREGIFKK